MNKPNSPELTQLYIWLADHVALQHYLGRYKTVHGLLDCDQDPSIAILYHLWQQRTEALALYLKAGDWLDWYCNDNDMGNQGLSAGPTGKMKPIRTLKQLLRLIQSTAAE